MKTVQKISGLILFLLIQISYSQGVQKTQNVSFTLDMKPILSVEFNAPSQINFVFDEKSKFNKGIVHEEATEIRVTSTVNWDMYAVGRSLNKNSDELQSWDVQKSFKSSQNESLHIPLQLLEIKQQYKNNGVFHSEANFSDYSSPFSTSHLSTSNNIYVSPNGTPTPPNAFGKYLAGHSGAAGYSKSGFNPPGSYYSEHSKRSNYHFVLDYRILPRTLAISPKTLNKNNSEPGFYSMVVQYVILEDQ